MPHRVLNFYFSFLLIISFTTNSISQEKKSSIPDSLKDKSYGYLLKQIHENYKDTISSIIYLNAALQKATINNDTIQRVFVLNTLSAYEKSLNNKLVLAKQIVIESEHLQDRKLIPIYTNVGGIYYDDYQHDIALKHYIKALRLAEKYNVDYYEYVLLNNIAKVKERIGAHKEALNLYKRCLKYETNQGTKNTIGNVLTVINLAESFRNNKKYDSASYYYHSIIDIAKEESKFYSDILTINEGINLYYKKEYIASEKLLKHGESFIDSYTNDQDIPASNKNYYILSQLYLGKIQLDRYQNEELAKEYFQNIISWATSSDILLPSIREAFEFLINYYEKKGDFKNQLDITNKLLKFNSLISSKRLKTVNKLHSDFDTPELLKSKEVLIKKLEKRTSFLSTQSYYLIILISLLLLLFIIQFNKRKKQKRHFEKVISKLNTPQTKSTSTSDSNTTISRKKLNIDATIITSVLEQLNLFEKGNEFLQPDINITTLAKRCNTNTKYLSRIINSHKNKSYSNYINDLRIDYILNELNNNTILQRYTIKSISEEAGFNTAESFASAFKKRTGIKPSYFIRNLKK